MQYRFDVWIRDEKVAVAIHPERHGALEVANRYASYYEAEYRLKTEIIEDFGDVSTSARSVSHALDS